MRTLFITIGLSAISSIAVAQTLPNSFDSSVCPMVGSLATTVMTKRQANVPMSDLMQALDKMDQSTPTTRVIKTMTIQAYSVPLFSTDEAKQSEISDFANGVMVACYSSAGK
jgi:hypothetical protein